MQGVEVVQADITTLRVDAVVNAANETLLGGGGVDGAIHRAAGPELHAACRALGGCPTGEARITPGFRLPARHVIHAVGPFWHGGGRGEDALLSSAYRASLALAREHALESLAFPAISCGAYRFPLERAIGLALDTTLAWLRTETHPARVLFCCFSAEHAQAYEAALSAREGE